MAKLGDAKPTSETTSEANMADATPEVTGEASHLSPSFPNATMELELDDFGFSGIRLRLRVSCSKSRENIFRNFKVSCFRVL